MRTITAVLASSVLLLTACADDDDDSGGAIQDQAADALIQQADDQNLDPDEACIRDKAAGLSDDDAQKIVDAGDQTADLSPEGLAIEAEAMSCVSSDALLDQMIESLPENVDADCVRDKLADADFGDIVQSGTLPPEINDAITECGTG